MAAHVYVGFEPIVQSQVGPKTSLTIEYENKGHELHWWICNFDDKHEV